MPKSTNLAYYPSQYFDIAAAVAQHQDVRVSFSTSSEAKALRLDYYGFRAAVKKMGAEASTQVRANVEAVHIVVHGCEVIFSHADASPAAKAIRRALEGLKADAPPPPAAAIVASVALPPPVIAPVDSGLESSVLNDYMKKQEG